jgi:hypothetical protein
MIIPKWQIKPIIGIYISDLMRKYNLGASLIIQYDKDDNYADISGSKTYGFSKIKFSKKDIENQTELARYISSYLSSGNEQPNTLFEEFKSGEGFLFFSDFLGGNLT